eukprot:Sdes_comp15111_c0_seq1m3918
MLKFVASFSPYFGSLSPLPTKISSRCWICFEDMLPPEDFSVCQCSHKELKTVHMECIQKWIFASNIQKCRFCRQPYRIKQSQSPSLHKTWKTLQTFLEFLCEYNLEDGTKWNLRNKIS